MSWVLFPFAPKLKTKNGYQEVQIQNVVSGVWSTSSMNISNVTRIYNNLR